jgi:hypothetical protein
MILMVGCTDGVKPDESQATTLTTEPLGVGVISPTQSRTDMGTATATVTPVRETEVTSTPMLVSPSQTPALGLPPVLSIGGAGSEAFPTPQADGALHFELPPPLPTATGRFNLTDQIALGLGMGGGGASSSSSVISPCQHNNSGTDTNISHRVGRWGEGLLCIELADSLPFTIQLVAPNGATIVETTYFLEENTEGAMYLKSSQEGPDFGRVLKLDSGMLIAVLPFYLPPDRIGGYGVSWTLLYRSDDSTHEYSFIPVPYELLAQSLSQPQEYYHIAVWDPAVTTQFISGSLSQHDSCATIYANTSLGISGLYFEPNSTIQIGLYISTDETIALPPDGDIGSVKRLLAHFTVLTNEVGSFKFSINTEALGLFPGEYSLIPAASPSFAIDGRISEIAFSKYFGCLSFRE